NPFPEGIRSVTVNRFQFLQECQNQVLRPQGPMDHSAKSNPGHTSCLLLLCCQGSSFNHMIAWYYRLVNMFFAKRTKKSAASFCGRGHMCGSSAMLAIRVRCSLHSSSLGSPCPL